MSHGQQPLPDRSADARARYEARRDRAFALARDGADAEALRVLADGCSDAWPFAGVYALDVARVRLVAGHPDGALIALWLEIGEIPRLRRPERELLVECVSARPSLWRLALGVVRRSRAPVHERALARLAITRARLRRSHAEPA